MPRFGISHSFVADELKGILADLESSQSAHVVEARLELLISDFGDLMRYDQSPQVREDPTYWERAGIDINKVRNIFSLVNQATSYVKVDRSSAIARIRRAFELWA